MTKSSKSQTGTQRLKRVRKQQRAHRVFKQGDAAATSNEGQPAATVQDKSNKRDAYS